MTTFCKNRSRAARQTLAAKMTSQTGTARIFFVPSCLRVSPKKTAAKKTGSAVISALIPRQNHLNQILIGFRAFSAHWRAGLHPGFAVSSAA
jgi:hypothetical protein